MDEDIGRNINEVKPDSENNKEDKPKPIISRKINIKVAIWSMITVFVFAATLFSSGIVKQRNILIPKAFENPSLITTPRVIPRNLQPTLTPTLTPTPSITSIPQ